MSTKRKSSSSDRSRRQKPMVPKSGLTRDGKRRYGCGGKLKK